MKKIIVLAGLVTLFANTAFAQKKKNDNGKAAKIELKNYNDSVSYALGMLYANSMKEQGFTNLNNEMIVQVFSDALNNRITDSTALIETGQCSPIVNSFFQKKQEMVAQQNLKEGQAFLEKNKTMPGVVTLASGLQYKVVKEGTGAKPGPTDNVTVHYHGTLIDGRVFDSSVERGQTIDFPLNGVIKGWTEGLQHMSEGAKYIFYIPSHLAYGERGAQGSIIGPNATLIFEVELIKVGK